MSLAQQQQQSRAALNSLLHYLLVGVCGGYKRNFAFWFRHLNNKLFQISTIIEPQMTHEPYRYIQRRSHDYDHSGHRPRARMEVEEAIFDDRNKHKLSMEVDDKNAPKKKRRLPWCI